jgi:glycosyltransferase involved in cell wall biosynthesis
MYSVEHLLELWDEIRVRAPRARLWLLGEPGERLRTRVAGRDDIVLFGRVSRDEILAYVANFDVALYPRTEDRGVQAAKTAEYLGGGAPIVSYDFEVVSELRGTGAALLVRDAREFVAAVVRLAEDGAERARLAEASRRLGRERDWDELGRRYGEILDRYLS